MVNLLLGGFTGFLIGIIFILLSANYVIKHAVSITIDYDTFKKADMICKEHGGLLLKITAYYNEDIFYCDKMKIIAKKDREQGMWTEFTIVRPIVNEE